MIVNLISDTITKPTFKMLEAMFSAPVGDDVFKEDPTVNKLEHEVASLFGKEAALFFSVWHYDKSNCNKNSYPTR